MSKAVHQENEIVTEEKQEDITSGGQSQAPVTEPSTLKSVRLSIKDLKTQHLAIGADSAAKMEAVLEEHESIDSICADACNNLAAVYETQGHFEEARRFYDESMQLRKLIHGPKSEKVAECLQNIGTVNDKLGYLSEAEELYKEALQIFIDLRGEQSRDVSMVLNNLGLLYNSMVQLYGSFYSLTCLLLSAFISILFCLSL